MITLSSLIQSLLNHIKTTIFHIKNESGSWLASLSLRDCWPVPSVNIRNQAMMLSKFFSVLMWCLSTYFCWALYFMGKIILLTTPRWKKSHAAMPLIISSSGGQWPCKQTHIRRKVWWQIVWEHFLSHPSSPTAKSWPEHPVHNWRRPAPWISPF